MFLSNSTNLNKVFLFNLETCFFFFKRKKKKSETKQKQTCEIVKNYNNLAILIKVLSPGHKCVNKNKSFLKPVLKGYLQVEIMTFS